VQGTTTGVQCAKRWSAYLLLLTKIENPRLSHSLSSKENDILTPYFDSTLDSLTWHA